ncbi:hypothetical protein ACFVR2_14695 [Gottfriedia sp. NPDC057991]
MLRLGIWSLFFDLICDSWILIAVLLFLFAILENLIAVRRLFAVLS